MDQVKKDIKEPILEDTLYEGGDVGIDDCTGSKRNTKILYICMFLCIGIFAMTFAMRKGDGAEVTDDVTAGDTAVVDAGGEAEVNAGGDAEADGGADAGGEALFEDHQKSTLFLY